jgi:hypothetical protein
VKRFLVIALVTALSLAALAAPAVAQYRPESKSSLVIGPAGPWGEAAIKFADLLEERTQGRINEFLLLNQGVADFAFGSTINISSCSWRATSSMAYRSTPSSCRSSCLSWRPLDGTPSGSA